MRKRAGFTLVELLVVIGIVAVLIGILMPSLSKARAAGIRTQCMANQRQLLQALNQYQSMYKNKMPCGIQGGNLSGSRIVHYAIPGDFAATREAHTDGWTHLGWLWIRGIIKDARVYYCPVDERTYENDWVPNITSSPIPRIYTSYSYRIAYCNQPVNSPNSLEGFPAFPTYPGSAADQLDEIRTIRAMMVGRMRGIRAVTADHLAYPDRRANWAHVRPVGICVGYSDGHCDYMPLSDREWNIVQSFTLADADKYQHMLYRAYDTGNFLTFRRAFGL